MVSNQQVVDILLNSADPRGVDPVRLDSWTVHGGLNLHNAMSYGSANSARCRRRRRSDGDGWRRQWRRGCPSGRQRLLRSDGTITSYEWIENGISIGSGATPLIALANGTHTIILQVMDNQGATDTDSVIITVNPLAPNSPPSLTQGLITP